MQLGTVATTSARRPLRELSGSLNDASALHSFFGFKPGTVLVQQLAVPLFFEKDWPFATLSQRHVNLEYVWKVLVLDRLPRSQKVLFYQLFLGKSLLFLQLNGFLGQQETVGPKAWAVKFIRE
jgi:hypothetical protein